MSEISEIDSEGKQVMKRHSIGFDENCKCPVCLFTRSQAPGQPYDLKKCPKFNDSNKK